MKHFLFAVQVRGRMLSTTTAIIHWDEPEEPNGQVVGYRVYYTSDNTLPVNQVCTCKHSIVAFIKQMTDDLFASLDRATSLLPLMFRCVLQWEKQMVRSANFITIQGLTPNKTYYIRVLAFTSVGDGPLSQDLQIIAKTGGRTREAKERCKDVLLGMF